MIDPAGNGDEANFVGGEDRGNDAMTNYAGHESTPRFLLDAWMIA